MATSQSVIASSGDGPHYDTEQSRWFGKYAGRKLRVLFSFYSPDGNEISMPIASMSAFLKRECQDVEVLLAPILVGRFPDRFTPDKFAAQVAALQPDLFAFSLMSPHWQPSEPFLEAIKGRLPDLPIVIGGYQAMLSQDETMANPHVDFICVGDGELAIANLVRHLQGTESGPVDGMWERMVGGAITKTDPHQLEDLNALPFPDYEIFAKEDGYKSVISSIFGPKGKIVLPVMTGRGCPYRCTYCCNTPLLEDWKNKKTFLRKYDAEALVAELERLRDEYEVGYFEFWDELFLSNLKFVKAFFALYKERVRLPFSINSRVEVMNEAFCQMAAEAGCHTIWFGIESGDEKYRATMLGRKMSNQQILNAAENCKNAGIFRLTFNIVGMPLESAENMRQTLQLNRQIAPEFFFFFPYIPLRGTPLYDRAREEGLLLSLKSNIHYLSAVNDQQFELNLKELPERLSAAEYDAICREMMGFQEHNNRLSYLSGNQGSQPTAIQVPASPSATAGSAPVTRIEAPRTSARNLKTVPAKSEKETSMSGRAKKVREILTLRSPRLLLERLGPQHADYLLSTYSDDGFWNHYRSNQNRRLDRERLRQLLAKESRLSPAKLGKIEWVISRVKGQEIEPIGVTGLTAYSELQSRAEFLVGIVNESDREPGLGLEASLLVFDFAFNLLKLNKLVSFVYAGNTEAQSNTLALGFEQEGQLRQHFRTDSGGPFIDIYQNGMLQSQFRINGRLGRLARRLLQRDITRAERRQGRVIKIGEPQVNATEKSQS